MALRTFARSFHPRDQTSVDGVRVTVPQSKNNDPGSFEKFMELPAELRQQIWKETVVFASLILTYERKCDDATTLDINLFSRTQTSIATVCFESREVLQKNQGKLNANSGDEIVGILALGSKLDIIHFGPEFELEHLELFAERIGKTKIKEVRHLILENKFENAYNGDGDGRRTLAPKFYKICGLLPELTRIIFVSHNNDRGSKTLVGDLVFTSLDSTGISEADGRTFKEFAQDHYPVFLERQLAARRMANTRPEILFMEPVEISSSKN